MNDFLFYALQVYTNLVFLAAFAIGFAAFVLIGYGIPVYLATRAVLKLTMKFWSNK